MADAIDERKEFEELPEHIQLAVIDLYRPKCGAAMPDTDPPGLIRCELDPDHKDRGQERHRSGNVFIWM